jgi:hypothetical protein
MGSGTDEAQVIGNAFTDPPHCGLELWDVVSAFDNVANQNTSYRVSGYTFEYDTFQGNYRHILDLGAR